MNKLPIFFAVDNNYIPFLTVTLESLIDNISDKNFYDIKILYTSITKENQQKIKKYKKENVSIEFVNVTNYIENIQNKLYTRDYFSKTTYYRLLIPDLYPEYDKALYLDSDIIILEDIANLFNINIGNNLVGAVPDGAIQSTKEFQEYVELVVGMSHYNKYFNAGILLMNLKELRAIRFKLKFIYLLDIIKFRVAQDQDYLNRICKGRATLIDSAWNVMPAAIPEKRSKVLKIIHFNLNKPWHLDNIPYEEYFWKYAKKSEFYETILDMKNNFSEAQKQNDIQTLLKLMQLAQKEADCVGDDRNSRG